MKNLRIIMTLGLLITLAGCYEEDVTIVSGTVGTGPYLGYAVYRTPSGVVVGNATGVVVGNQIALDRYYYREDRHYYYDYPDYYRVERVFYYPDSY